MTHPDNTFTLSFETPELLNDWLAENHDVENELMVKIYKKASGIKSITWQELVLECLCWGWIDGVKKSLNDEAYLQRITPRRARSGWSKINTEHVQRLTQQGRMQEPGLQQVRAAKEDGRWEKAYAPASQMTIPDDFLLAVDKDLAVKAFYNSLNKSSLYAIAYGLDSAKKPETRQRRFDKFITMLQNREKPGFGFKKKN